MSDVAQILGLNRETNDTQSSISTPPSSTANSTPGKAIATKTKVKSRSKKLTGMQREVIELLESTHRTALPIYPSFSKPSLQQQWKENKKPAVKWSRRPFVNPARTDYKEITDENGEKKVTKTLILTHWAKENAPASDYIFAKFNQKCEVTNYTAMEYEIIDPIYQNAAKTEEKVWTKEETDQLFALCLRYDLRWVVITDQFNKKEITRSMEELKYRYYEFTRLLVLHREQRQEDENSMDLYKFNAGYEVQRKKQLDAAFHRSTEEENEIKQLTDELKTVEQQLKKQSLKIDQKKKRTEFAHIPLAINREIPSGVYLRSMSLALPSNSIGSGQSTETTSQTQGNMAPLLHRTKVSPKLEKKMIEMLTELGIPSRPMPTKDVCDAYDALRSQIFALLSLRKHLSSRQHEVAQLRDKYQQTTGKAYTKTTTPLLQHKPTGNDDTTVVISESDAPAMMRTPSKGKAFKHSEKAFKSSGKRKNSSSVGSLSKRSKKTHTPSHVPDP